METPLTTSGSWGAGAPSLHPRFSETLQIQKNFSSFEDYWQPFLAASTMTCVASRCCVAPNDLPGWAYPPRSVGHSHLSLQAVHIAPRWAGETSKRQPGLCPQVVKETAVHNGTGATGSCSGFLLI